jgi:DNA mismatch endonuclease (patch repair protein)
MADVFSRSKRSHIMSRVKGRGNRTTELKLIEVFREFGFRGWRRNSRMFGRPDFIFPTHRIAIFVDGCFWHGCPKHGQVPATNYTFWAEKLRRNKLRDRLVGKTLRKDGWIIFRIWQHELRDTRGVVRRLEKRLPRLLDGRSSQVPQAHTSTRQL